MEAKKLYTKLKNDFIKEGIKDIDWANRMPELDSYLFPEFMQNGGMGLMCDFTDEIKKVYTTVFLSEKVLCKLLSDNISNAMLFSHHPTNWNLKNNNGNYTANEEYIAELKERNISIYILHHPLDNFGRYSTCGTLAARLKINIEKPAFLYCGALCGIIGTTDCKTTGELRDRFSQTLGHKTSLYQYGCENIQGEKIALCPGGGNDMFVLNEMLENNIKTLITGLTIVNDYSRETHEYEKKNKINLLGGTHYSSEKYAPMEMCKYFNDLGLPSEFIDDEPDLYDL
ncbi:MAG: Nif3-like dinuclear metal center hexameric protein [Oscillospiraceae bacterium]|nr:Nif3-like dinuclear metal center hexameric protein [Oscillospiraceae bacterium]